jgi:hypothetical protein
MYRKEMRRKGGGWSRRGKGCIDVWKYGKFNCLGKDMSLVIFLFRLFAYFSYD